MTSFHFQIQEFYLSGKTIDFPEDLITKGDEGRSRATHSSDNSSYNGNTKCTNPSDRDSNEVRTNDCEENESEAKLPDYSKVNNGQRTSSVLDPEEHIYSTGYSSTSSTDRNVKIKRTVTDIMAKCWAKAEDRIETNIILRDLRNVHSGYVDHGMLSFTTVNLDVIASIICTIYVFGTYGRKSAL